MGSASSRDKTALYGVISVKVACHTVNVKERIRLSHNTLKEKYMNIKCLFGYHDWGKQKNIREVTPSDEAALLIPLVAILSIIWPSKECEVECLRCGKVKTIFYDSRRGQ
jgi:hypothetical protein